MKKLTSLVFFILISFIYSQVITELRGLEDKSGVTHLFYRMGYNENELNSIYHLNITNDIDTLFLKAYRFNFPYPTGEIHLGISDYDFIDNDPSKYIWCGSAVMPDNIGYISFYNNTGGFSKFDRINNIELSRQDTNLIYADYNGYLMHSTDFGLTWNYGSFDSFLNINLLSLSPFNDKIIFAVDKNNHLVKSVDGNSTFRIADSSGWTFYDTSILFDKDTSTVYAITSWKDKWTFFVSENSGNNFEIKYESDLKIIAINDNSISGRIFLCEGNNILKSNDYGKTFNLFAEQNSPIVGIYVKPNSDKIYIATKNSIIELNNQNTFYLKQLTSVNNKPEVPNNFSLSQNYPNPFNPTTKIKYTIPSNVKREMSNVNLTVYDILGNEVANLVNEEKPAGSYEVSFSAGSCGNGSNLSSGIYFYVLNVGTNRLCKKMCLIK